MSDLTLMTENIRAALDALEHTQEAGEDLRGRVTRENYAVFRQHMNELHLRLRDLNTSKQPVVFRTNMDAGHGGKSGRFRRYREQAEMFAFLLDQLAVEPAVK